MSPVKSCRRIAGWSLRGLLAFAAAIAVATLVASASAVSAAAPETSERQCSCQDLSLAKQFAASDAVFIGQVRAANQSQNPSPQGARILYRTAVLQVIKGDSTTQQIDVVADREYLACGGARLEPRQRIAFFTSVQGNEVVIRPCGGALVSSPGLEEELTMIAAAVEAEAEDQQDEEAASVDFEVIESSTPSTWRRNAAPGAALVLLGLLGLVVTQRLARPQD